MASVWDLHKVGDIIVTGTDDKPVPVRLTFVTPSLLEGMADLPGGRRPVRLLRHNDFWEFDDMWDED